MFLGTSTAILIVPALLIAGFLYFWVGLTSSKLEISDSSLDFKTVFYGKSIDISDITIDSVKLFDYNDKQNSPSYRTNGISLVWTVQFISFLSSDLFQFNHIRIETFNVLYLSFNK